MCLNINNLNMGDICKIIAKDDIKVKKNTLDYFITINIKIEKRNEKVIFIYYYSFNKKKD